MKIIYLGHLERRFGIFGCQILCITDLAIMPLVLPEEEAKVPMWEEGVTEQVLKVGISDCILQDASTQTPKQKLPGLTLLHFPLHLALASSQPNSTVLRDACCKLGILWRLPLLGPSVANLGRSIAEAGKLRDACLHSQ